MGLEGERCRGFGQSAGGAVFSEKPWFTKSDADGSLRLKPGYWGIADCAPVKSPGCPAMRVEVAGSELHFPARWTGSKPDPLTRPIMFIAVPGNPAVVQVELSAPPEYRDKFEAVAFYFYAGFAPTRRDGDGQIIAGEVWPVICGSAPKPGDPNYGYTDDQGQITNNPLPGLKMGGGGCTAEDRAALVSAARATRTMDEAPLKVEWKSLTPPMQTPQ